MDANLQEGLRWLGQAEADLSGAQASLKTKHYEWACFQSQQSAEKAAKAFLYANRMRLLMTHSVKELIQSAKKIKKEFQELEDDGRYLDTFYLPTRYPDALPGSDIPARFYSEKEALKCVDSAQKILDLAKKFLKQ